MSSRYSNLRLIAVGALSDVFEADVVDGPPGGRSVALRRLRAEIRGDARIRGGWVRTARSLLRVDHPNLVKVIDVIDDDEPTVVLELLAGADLRTVIRRAAARGIPTPAALIVHVARSVATGLAALHATGDPTPHLHLAVIPSKVFIERGGQVKLLCSTPPDASTALDTASAEARGERQRHTSLQAAVGRPLTLASDLWQLGVCLFELATEERLFEGATGLATLRAVLGAPVPPLGDKRPDLPAALVHIVTRLLERDAARQYASAQDLLEDLAAVSVSDEEALRVARDALPAPGELDDLDVTQVDREPSAPVDLQAPPTERAWESATDAFSEELSDVFDLRTGLMPPPTMPLPAIVTTSRPPPSTVEPASPTPSPLGAPMFTAIGPAPDEGPAWPAQIAGYRVVRPIDAIEPWQRFVVADVHKQRFVLWTRAMDERESAQQEQRLQTLARVRHPSVALPSARGYIKGAFFVAYERIEGAALETLMRGTGDQPAAVVALILRDVLAALGAAHDAGVLHGSVRPRTIRLSSSGHAVLHGLGLGLSTPVDETDALRRVAYASPEQCAGAAGTEASNLYQCGALIYELLTGIPPSARATVADTLAALRDARPTRLIDHALAVPWQLERVHGRLLEPAPDARYASAAAAAKELQPLVAAVEATHDGGLGSYVVDPIDGHLKLSQRHAQAELALARELLEESPAHLGAAAFALLRAQHLDPANADVNRLLRRTVARAGYSMQPPVPSKLRQLETSLATNRPDAGGLKALVEAAREERGLPELVRYLFAYVQAAPDDARARAELDSLTSHHAAEPFAALARAGYRRSSPPRPAARGPTAAKPTAGSAIEAAHDDEGNALPFVFAGLALLSAIAALAFLLTR